MVIRQAHQEDIPKIVPVWRELMEFHAQRDAFYEPCDGAEGSFTAYVSENIESDNALVLVAELDGRCVGYCQCRIETYPPVFHIKQYGQISDICVLGEHRRTGVGEQLVGRAMEWFRTKRMTRIEVRRLKCNEISSKFWPKQGFIPYLETLYQPLDFRTK